jgi:hypothetical protein
LSAKLANGLAVEVRMFCPDKHVHIRLEACRHVGLEHSYSIQAATQALSPQVKSGRNYTRKPTRAGSFKKEATSPSRAPILLAFSTVHQPMHVSVQGTCNNLPLNWDKNVDSSHCCLMQPAPSMLLTQDNSPHHLIRTSVLLFGSEHQYHRITECRMRQER